MSFGPFSNPTQALGFCSFAAAAIGCAWAARMRGTMRRPWVGMAIIHAALALEVLLGWRYQWHDLIASWMMDAGSYGDRRPLQAAMIVGLTLLAVAAWFRWRPDRAATGVARVAVWGTAFALLNFMIESISLHQIDALLYRPVGPVLVNGLLWAGASSVVMACAVTAVRRGRAAR